MDYEENDYEQYEESQPEKPEKKGSGKSIAGLILGLLSFVLFIIGLVLPLFGIYFYAFGFVFALIGVILTALGIKTEDKKGCAIAGLVFSIIGLLVNLILFAACGLCVALAAGAAGSM